MPDTSETLRRWTVPNTPPSEAEQLELGICYACAGSFRREGMREVYQTYGGHAAYRRLHCEGCFQRLDVYNCIHCDHPILWDSGYSYSTNDGLICRGCMRHFFHCDGCSEVYHRNEYAGDGYCESCYNDRDEEQGIESYGHQYPRSALGTPPHFYGVELEVEMTGEARRNEKARQAIDALGRDFILVKDDGSLDCGFELVTAPASLAEQKKRWLPFFKSEAMRGLRSYQTRTCGLHVHCSRAPLSELTIAKIVCFVNAAHNRRFMAVVAGRASTSYAKYCVKKMATAAQRNPDRYEAVNLQNDCTIEFRCFKGTLKKESVFKAIEFCDALIHYCLPASRSVKESQSRVGFIKFVKSHARDYPHLLGFIEAKWFGQTTKLTQACRYAAGVNNEGLVQTEEI